MWICLMFLNKDIKHTHTHTKKKKNRKLMAIGNITLEVASTSLGTRVSSILAWKIPWTEEPGGL